MCNRRHCQYNFPHGMRPRLIPHEFTLKQARRKYHTKRSERTWWEWTQQHQSALFVVAGVLALVFILYLRYHEQKRKQQVRAATQTRYSLTPTAHAAPNAPGLAHPAAAPQSPWTTSRPSPEQPPQLSHMPRPGS